MVAVRNSVTEDRTLLSFHKGDIIRLQHMDGLEAGETHAHTRAVSHVEYVTASACFTCPCASVCARVFRQTLRLHREEEGHASGGAEEGHSGVRWVFVLLSLAF